MCREEEHKLAQTMAHGRECVLMLDQLHEQQSRHNKQYCGLVPTLLQQLHAAQVSPHFSELCHSHQLGPTLRAACVSEVGSLVRLFSPLW